MKNRKESLISFIIKRKISSRPLIFAIILLGFFLRIYKLGVLSLWLPEARIVCFAKKNIFEILDFSNAYRPVYLLLARMWMWIFGTNEIAIRFLPLIFGLASILLIYKIGKLLWNKKIGLIAAYILSLSVFHVYFSREGKGVASFLFFLILSSFFIILKIIYKGNLKYYFYNIFLNILILFTHPMGVFWLFTQNLCYFLFKKRKKVKRWLFSTMINSIFLWPWYIVMMHYHPDLMALNFKVPTLNTMLHVFVVFSCGGSKIMNAGEGAPLSYYNMIFPAILTAVYLFIFISEMSIFDKKRVKECDGLLSEQNKKNVLLAWFLCPLIMVYFYSIFFHPIYYPRYIIYASAAFYLLIAHFISKIVFRWRVFLLIIIFVLSLFSLNNLYNPEAKDGFKDGVSFLKDNIKEGEILVLLPAELMAIIWYYYEYDNHEVMGNIDRERGMKIAGEWKTDFEYKGNRILCLQFDQIRRFSEEYNFDKNLNLTSHKGIWLLYAPWWPATKNGKFFDNFLDERYKLEKRGYFREAGLFIKYYK